MKLVDANVLINAVNAEARHHRAAKRWLDDALSGSSPVGFAWLALVAFVRITTHPSLAAMPLALGEAMAQVEEWLDARSAHVLQPGPRHAELLGGLLRAVGTAGNLTNDAHLAALALEHKATVVTFDSDFGRFPGVRWERPR